MSLEDQFETSANFFLADSRNSDDFFESSWNTFLSTSDVETCRANGVVRSSSQVFTVMDFLEECIGAVSNSPREINSIAHGSNRTKCVDQCTIRAADTSAICVPKREENVKLNSYFHVKKIGVIVDSSIVYPCSIYVWND